MAGTLETQHVALQLLVDVPEARGSGHSRSDAKGHPVSLPRAMIRVLTQDDDFDLIDVVVYLKSGYRELTTSY